AEASPEAETAGIGLRGDYFAGTNFDKLVRTRLDRRINTFWQSNPDAGLDSNKFSVRWTGFVCPPGTGTYTFHTETDDGARLWVGDGKLIDDWTDRTQRDTKKNSGKIDLEAGKRYPIRLEYYDATSSAIVKLGWSGPGVGDKQFIATKYLFPPDGWPPASPWSGEWRKAPSGKVPEISGRQQATAFDGLKGRLFVVGEKLEVLSYSPAGGEWKQLSAPAAGDGKELPTRLRGFNATYVPGMGGLLVCGGGQDAKEGGTLFFDVKTAKWKWLVREDAEYPALALGRSMLVRLYTMERGAQLFFDQFDFTNGKWVKVDVKLPPYRHYPGDSMVYDPDQKGFMMWGSSRYTDTWIYKPAGRVWRELRPEASAPVHTRPTTCYDRGNRLFVMHGGLYAAGKTGDTWVFDAGRNCWFVVKENTVPHGGVDRLEYDPLSRTCIGWKASAKEVWTLRITKDR
ncbi:MAG: PA14 domain-containing protein, partial [Planctomycetota bacterium]